MTELLKKFTGGKRPRQNGSGRLLIIDLLDRPKPKAGWPQIRKGRFFGSKKGKNDGC